MAENHARPSEHARTGNAWQLIVLVGVVGAVGEAVLASSDPAVVVFAAIYAVGAALAYKRKLAGVLVVGLMSLVEVVFVPFYPRESTSDWLIQVSFAILGLIGVVAAVRVLQGRRWRAATTAERESA